MAHYNECNQLWFHREDKTSFLSDLQKNENRMSTKIKWLKIKEKQGLLTLDQQRQRDHELKIAEQGIKPKSKYSWN